MQSMVLVFFSFILFLVIGNIAIVNLSKYLYFIILHQDLSEIIKLFIKIIISTCNYEI